MGKRREAEAEEAQLSSGLFTVELTVEREGEARRHTLRVGQTFIAGRSKKVAIRLRHDPLISRQHAAIELRPDGVYVTDLGSRNGTHLTGLELTPHEPVLAGHDSRLTVGEHSILIRYSGVESDDRDPTTRIGLPVLPENEFDLLGLIGIGTSGMVFAAHQKLLRRKVAIKVLNEDLARDPQQRERFMREGWISSQIRSPHVVDIYDMRTIRGRVCMIMELVQGPSALDRLQDGALPLTEVLRIGEDVALALIAAQEVGVIHRDIKPSNILLDPRGQAKLTDFGIARKQASGASPDPSGSPERGLGTTDYVSPEQAKDPSKADVRSDLYSLGATLYHLLSGQRPAHGAPIPLTDLGLSPAPPAALVELIHALLEEDPAKRPHPVSAVADSLHTIRLQLAGRPPTPGIYETTEGKLPPAEPKEE